MSLIPSLIDAQPVSDIFEPFYPDLLESFQHYPSHKPLYSASASFPELSWENCSVASTRIDWKETLWGHLFKADLPGLSKEGVKVEVEDDRVLQISGERKMEEDKGDTFHLIERSSGKFQWRFILPEKAKMDRVKASMENGVLTVIVPKAEVRKPDVRSIQISGA